MKNKLEKLGFKAKKEYTHGDNNEFKTISFAKGCITIELDFDSKTDVLLCSDVSFEEDYFDNITIEEIAILDKILNKLL